MPKADDDGGQNQRLGQRVRMDRHFGQCKRRAVCDKAP